jgi:formylglycine-generating enzyme required for sulfatase activity
MPPEKTKKTSDSETQQSKETGSVIPEMVLIPQGKAWIGTSDDQIQFMLHYEEWAQEWYDSDLFTVEQPQHEVMVPAFKIGKKPITNDEYYSFLNDAGFRIPKGWIGLHYLDGQANHPVTSVSWEDALAYISWLSSKTGQAFRLPNEIEWEKAARGPDKRIYPWGDKFDPWRCNTSEGGKRSTNEPGEYSPGGDSPFGMLDMVGNVWEWTSSLLLPYPYQDNHTIVDPKTPGKRVVRGGAWYYSRKLARCSSREGMLPNLISTSMGFRLAQSV